MLAVLDIEHTEEIAELKKKLNEYRSVRRKKASEKETIEEAIGKLQKKCREIEEGLQETADTISRRLDRLPSRCKFRITYFEQAKSKFLNSQSSNAVEQTREAERIAKNKLLDLEDDIEELDRRIHSTEERIRQLSQQAN